MAKAEIDIIHKKDFYPKVLDASFSQPVIVMFYGPKCGPCKVLEPMLETAVNKYKVRTYKFDGFEAGDLAFHYKSNMFPSVVVFHKAYGEKLPKMGSLEKVNHYVEMVKNKKLGLFK